MRRRVRLTVVLCLAVSAPAAGQGTFRQDVVVTAAAVPVELGTVTRTLTVITREQIQSLPVTTVADALRLVGSIDVRARGERGVQTDFAIRGANFGQILVLVDGVRLNDVQTGHHNGDIPVPLDAVERIEVLHGPGSSLFGADAFGGTVNVITRRDAGGRLAAVEGGSFGLVGARGRIGHAGASVHSTLTASAERSSGFMLERGYRTAVVTSQVRLGDRAGLSASHLSKDFGANGFYGNAPSHEWTNQTLLAADRTAALGGWQTSTGASYRTHGDRFLFDVRRPGMFENRHRTHAALGTLRATRSVLNRASISASAEIGRDWVRSSNLGDHALTRAGAAGEWRQAFRATTQVDASLRVDRYSDFGTAWSPAAGVGWWPDPRVRLRASAGRAFRVPTYTERFYSDPAHLARAEIGPERTWAAEGGADLFLSGGWSVSSTLFTRRDRDVIDWLRSSPAERWRTANIRRVRTLGFEVAARRPLGGGSFVQAGYTGLDVDAAGVVQLSKYVLDYAPHSVVAAASFAMPGAVRVAPRVEYRHRTRGSGEDDYVLVDLRLSRRVGVWEARLEGLNLGDATYEEVTGVLMPGRAVTVSLVVGR